MPKFLLHILFVVASMFVIFIFGLLVYVWQYTEVLSLNFKCRTFANQLTANFSKSLFSKNQELANLKTKSSWYDDMINKIEQLPRSNEKDSKCTLYAKNGIDLPQPVKGDCLEGMVKAEDIKSITYLKDNNSTIVLIPGVYGGAGFKLLKYNIDSGTLETAKREDVDGGKESSWFKKTDVNMNLAPDQKSDVYYWFATPQKIISFKNNIIELSGEAGDAGCWRRSKYEYDIIQNFIKIIEDCYGCGDITDKCNKY